MPRSANFAQVQGPDAPSACPRAEALDVAIIVPVFAQAELLPSLLAGLAAQTWHDFEVVVVDNAPMPAPAVARAVAAASEGPAGLRVRVLHASRPGSYAARNAGAAATSARWLVFTDADCQPEPHWLAELLAAARRRPGHLLAGPIRCLPGPAPSLWAIYDCVRGIPQDRYVRRGYAATANLLVPRAVWLDLGGFEPSRLSGGDADFCRRAGKRGHPIALVPGAVVGHPARATWAEVATKARRIKGGQMTAGRRRRRALWFLYTHVPPLSDVVRLLRAPYPRIWRLRAAGVRLLLWAAEIGEVWRLLRPGVQPERR